jgi:mono/diheme cytochrome c family protein
VRAAFAILAVAALVAGCDQQMAEMPRYEAYEASPLFADGAAARPRVTGTVAREDDRAPRPGRMPYAVDAALLERGRERYGIFCAPCHSVAGDGDGIVVERGFPAPPTYHQPALRAASDRHIYDVITDGYGAMYSYAARVPPADRWAIVAYVRALQYARHAPVAELPAGLRARLDGEAGG